jgi:hypothetical protein
LLDNDRLTQANHYQPIAKAALHGLKGQSVQLLIDRVLLRDRHNILVVSVGFRRRPPRRRPRLIRKQGLEFQTAHTYSGCQCQTGVASTLDATPVWQTILKSS